MIIFGYVKLSKDAQFIHLIIIIVELFLAVYSQQ